MENSVLQIWGPLLAHEAENIATLDFKKDVLVNQYVYGGDTFYKLDDQVILTRINHDDSGKLIIIVNADDDRLRTGGKKYTFITLFKVRGNQYAVNYAYIR